MSEVIAGYHDLWWMPAGVPSGAVLLGGTGPDGIVHVETENVLDITGDALGPQTKVDGVYQGKNLFLQFMLQDMKLTIVKKFLNPFTQANSSVTGAPEYMGTPGTLLSSYFGTLEAIPRTGTPAASLNAFGGNGRQYIGLVFGEKRYNLDNNPRFVPVTFQAYPFSDGGVTKLFKWITAAS